MNSSAVCRRPSRDSEQRSKHQKDTVIPIPTSPVCVHCQQLDLDKSFDDALQFYEAASNGAAARSACLSPATDGSHYYDDAFLVHRFHDRLSQPSHCPMCEFFWSQSIQPEQHGLYNKALYLVHGLPIWMDVIAGHVSSVYITFVLSASSWYHRTSDDLRMLVSEPCRRRSHKGESYLPSWTWAGWDGAVSWRAPSEHEHEH
jgi:hypothetical protein